MSKQQRRFCPLKFGQVSISPHLDDDRNVAICDQEECAWWDGMQCAVLGIAKAADHTNMCDDLRESASIWGVTQ